MPDAPPNAAKTPGKSDRKSLLVRLPEDLHKALRHLSVEQDKTMASIVEEALRAHLAKVKSR